VKEMRSWECQTTKPKGFMVSWINPARIRTELSQEVKKKSLTSTTDFGQLK
jgi:hypothetical protein